MITVVGGLFMMAHCGWCHEIATVDIVDIENIA